MATIPCLKVNSAHTVNSVLSSVWVRRLELAVPANAAVMSQTPRFNFKYNHSEIKYKLQSLGHSSHLSWTQQACVNST